MFRCREKTTVSKVLNWYEVITAYWSGVCWNDQDGSGTGLENQDDEVDLCQEALKFLSHCKPRDEISCHIKFEEEIFEI